MFQKNKISRVLRTNFLEKYRSEGFDFYHSTLKSSLFIFISNFVLIFLGLNAIFGFLYYLQPNSIAGVPEHNFLDCFFFSVQTMGTIGYGAYTPQTIYAHILVTVEVMIGLVGIGTFAALTFARISLPSGRLKFSEQCVVNLDDGEAKLMFRVVHLRSNMIMNAKISLQVLMPSTNVHGQIEINLIDLPLENDFYHVMTASWIVKHKITKESPIFGKTQEELALENCCLIATITGIDGTISQNVNHVYSYLPHDILWDRRFKSVIQLDEQRGAYVIDLNLVNDLEESFIKEPVLKKILSGLIKK
jgi:inward rectifier potassium channel